ncbi:hypothetical protein [Acinetobacter baumannii]|uniref:hypothetical protein n=1 Tax=Acinetobacter baumannii TaxID=470 RepID=UPI000445AD8A|nr:hypothetical protein [Acinetobacter baumannii]EXD50005.1 hypothetical protein J498_3755 [Acinetobacter baumannii 781407]EXE23173.1 hypothetical protein J564_3874 [Acinetobacter baumannii 1525283]OTS67223.1 hypothetical protein CAS98_04075 [Acinetobacter baumannii]TPS63229.1 hypothetical protein FJU46_18375 [Acinetobacter baumannii]HAV5296341.1 hypothetical protein [Acinetobacter baumannii]
MLENLKEKMCALNDVFIEYPKVFNRMMFYFILILGVILAYFPLIKWLVNLEIFNTYPFHDLIMNNFHLVQWGILIIPLVLIFIAISNAADLYEQLKMRKYGR